MKKIIVQIFGKNEDTAAKEITDKVINYLNQSTNIDGFVQSDSNVPRKEIQIPAFMANERSR